MKENEFTKRLIEIVLLKENRDSLKDINLTKLAKNIGIPTATFHQWLTGAFPKRIEHWKKLQSYFNCDLNYLISGIAPEKKDIPNDGKIIISDNRKRLLELSFNVMEKSEIKIIAK